MRGDESEGFEGVRVARWEGGVSRDAYGPTGCRAEDLDDKPDVCVVLRVLRGSRDPRYQKTGLLWFHDITREVAEGFDRRRVIICSAGADSEVRRTPARSSAGGATPQTATWETEPPPIATRR